MNAEGLDAAELNYWLALVLGEPVEALQVEGGRCIRPDGTIVDYLNDRSVVDLLVTMGLFGRHKNDRVIFNGRGNDDERFTAEIRRAEGQSLIASGPTVAVAVCRVVVAFAYQDGRSTVDSG